MTGLLYGFKNFTVVKKWVEDAMVEFFLEILRVV